MLRIIPLNAMEPSERAFLDMLFAAFDDVEWVPYSDPVPIEDNALYMHCGNTAMVLDSDLVQRLAGAKGIGLLHIGDEYLRSGLTEYGAFSYIIRSIPFPDADTDGVMTIPMGFTRGLGDRSHKPASERKFSWMFAGDWKADRGAMADQFQSWDGGLLSLPMPYEEDTRISRQEYLAGMADSAFAPCPAGNIVLETLRPYEALHFGAIPLLPKRKNSDSYRAILGDHPLPTFLDWKSAREFAEQVYADPERLNALQAECLQWWDDIQAKWAKDILAFVAEGQAETHRKNLQSHFAKPITTIGRFRELLAQQNMQQFRSRVAFRWMMLNRKIRGQAASASWSYGKTDS